MTQTKKFSQFNGPSPIQSGDIVVGLRIDTDGVLDNWQFTGVGSGGGGGTGVTKTITQPGHSFNGGEWVRVDVPTAKYVAALADTTSDAEVIGIIISSNIPAGTFVLQQSGYIDTTQAVPTITGLTPGVPQFLSISTAGAMQPMDVTVDGQISRPFFVPDSATSGWVLPYRGIITDGGPNTGIPSPTPGGTDSNIIVVTQNGHGFHAGDVLYVITPVGGQETYARAQANNFATANAIGVVVSPDPQLTNQFTLQECGYNLQSATVGGITTDDLGNPLVASTVYYLSVANAGKVSTINPTALGTFSRPIFVSARTALTSSVYAGWIFPQRPLDLSPTGAQDPTTHTVIETNTFQVGQWVYVSGDTASPPSYSLAKADTLAKAQVAGIIIAASGTQFTVQQSGWVTGAFTSTHLDGGGAVPSSQVLYLSSVTAGNLTTTVPGVGAISKPCYVQETVSSHVGEILPQRPLLIQSPGGGGSEVLIGTFPIVGPIATVVFSAAFPAIYTDIRIVGRNITVSDTTVTAEHMQNPIMQFEVGGVMRTDANYDGGATGLALAVNEPTGIWTATGHPTALPPAGVAQDFQFDVWIENANKTGFQKFFFPNDGRYFNSPTSNTTSHVDIANSGVGYQSSGGMVTGFQLTSLYPLLYVYQSGSISLYGTLA